MGFLDELREEADEFKTEEQREAERRAEQRQRYLREINPKLQEIYRYLHEMVEHISAIKRDILVNYEIPGIGTLKGFKQGNYRIRGDSLDEMNEIYLQFTCERPEKIQFMLQEPAKIRKCEEFLHDHRIEFHCRKHKDENFDVVGANFTLKSLIPVTVLFKADIDNMKIMVYLTNFEGFGSRKLMFRPDQIDTSLLDEFAKYLLRRENNFLKLDISEEERQRIREQVLAEQRKIEEAVKRAEAEEAERARKEAALKPGLKNIFNRNNGS